ncbi:MAG: adenylate/guanylate cyclase domain-containing protein [Chloroflexales bacterium]
MDPLTHLDRAFLFDLLGSDLWRELSGGFSSTLAHDTAVVRLRAALAAMSSYVPAPVLRAQFQRPVPGRISGAFWDGSILFADLSGFTALSGQLSTIGKQGAEEISALITALFGALAEEIHAHGGSLLKFGGDALTVFFDADALDQAHAALASNAALAMQRRMADFAAVSTPVGTFTLRLRIGVHSGPIFAAHVGNREHIELVVTGHNINRVAEAQEIASPGEVVISDTTLAQIHAAVTSERQGGFSLLTSAAAPPLPTTSGVAIPADAQATLPQVLDLIAALRPYLPYGLPQRFLSGDTASTGEFRPVTTVFANFWPFSQFLDLLGDDTETAALALNAYYRRAQETIHRYGGIVNKVDMYTHGDKLMALFGAPVAHEDDPERALCAALDLRNALAEANGEIVQLIADWRSRIGDDGTDTLHLSQKIGINTGVVFAGTVGGAIRHEYTVMGQPVNLAARLMGVAAEGGVVLSPSTRRAVAHRAIIRDLPPVRLKGVTDPVPLAEALGLQPFAHTLRNAPVAQGLVGRTGEMARLLAAGREAMAGAGRVVALAGTAGTGKTRLIDEALLHLGTPAATYRVESQSYAQTNPASTLRALLRAFFAPELATLDPAADVAARIGDVAPEVSRFTPLLGELLGLPIDETPLTSALTPEQRAERLRDLVLELLRGAAIRHPTVIVLDDLHWADSFSLDLIGTLVAGLADVPLLVVLGYRPDPAFAEPWRDLVHGLSIEIGELSAQESAALLENLLDDHPPPELLALLEKTQGNPLFVEELVQSLRETGDLMRDEGGWHLRRSPDAIGIPDRIEGLITARLDRLEERARETLQVAAVVGQRFAFPVLAEVMAQAADLARQIERLDGASMIAADAPPLVATYFFRHALIRDVAYDALLFARRRELHRRVAQVIVQISDTQSDELLALLARHYLLAESWPEALLYHLRAGRVAQRRYANREAIALFSQALRIIDSGVIAEPNPGDAAEIHERMGWLHLLSGAYDQALAHYHQALTLTPAESLIVQLRLHHHIAQIYEKRAEFETAFVWIDRALALPDAPQNPAVVRCLLLGTGLHQRQGHYAQALAWGDQALKSSELNELEHLQGEALLLLGGTHSLLGDHTRAHLLTSRCLELATQSGDLNRLADAHNNLALINHDLGRLDDAMAHYSAGAELKRAIGDVYGEALIANNLGDLLKLRGDLEAAEAQFARSLASFERLGTAYGAGVARINLGVTHMLRGNLDAAASDLERAGVLLAQAGAEDLLPELERSQAELSLRRDPPAQARRMAEQALATAIRLEASAEEGICRRVLAEVLAAAGDHTAAWEQLALTLAILHESDSPYEIARALLAMARLAPALGRIADGRAALDEALPALRALGARRELVEAEDLSARYNELDRP